MKLARFDGDALQVCDKKLVRYVNLKSSEEGSWFSMRRPEIDRGDLRRLLMDSLPSGVIRWGFKLKRVDPVDLTLEFENGVVEKGFDLIVGADGAWSKVRSLLSDQKPTYSGIGGYSSMISNAEERFPAFTKLVRKGSMFSYSDGKMLSAQQLGGGHMSVSWWGVRKETWMKEANFDLRNGKLVKESLLGEFEDWSDEHRALINAVDEDTITPRSLFNLPVGVAWSHKLGVTLLGDAAHVMTPFTGEGVNAAMKDATELAEAIAVAVGRGGGEEALSKTVQSYEEEMFRRAHKIMQMTEDMVKLLFYTEGAPRTVIHKLVTRPAEEDMNAVQAVLLRAFVTVYYFFFKLLH